jgi:hypothetical protein
MKKFFKIIGIIIGSILALLISIGIIVFGGSYLLDAKKEIEKPVYPADKIWTFSAEFYNTSSNLTRTDTVQLKTSNQRFMLTQNSITWILKSNDLILEETTGIIETENRLWIHPPRFNDYYDFTEYSAFPEIRQPISDTLAWEATILLGTFANDNTGNKVTMNYSITKIDTLNISPMNRKIEILGEGKSGLGVYTCKMDFQENVGFTKLSYTKENKEQLILKLLKIE